MLLVRELQGTNLNGDLAGERPSYYARKGMLFETPDLAARPRGVVALYFGVWPALTLITGILVRRRFI